MAGTTPGVEKERNSTDVVQLSATRYCKEFQLCGRSPRHWQGASQRKRTHDGAYALGYVSPFPRYTPRARPTPVDALSFRHTHFGDILRPSPDMSFSSPSPISSSRSPPPPPPSALLLVASTAAAAASETLSPPAPVAPAAVWCSVMDPDAAAEPPREPPPAGGRGVSGFGTAGRSCLRTSSGESTVDDVT